MAGLEPARAYTAQRILSPLRLPFRHIGAAACILSFFYQARKWISRREQRLKRLERVLVLGLEIL